MSFKGRLLGGILLLCLLGGGIAYGIRHERTESSAEEVPQAPVPVVTKLIPRNEPEEKQSLAIEIALHDFESLEDFNSRFSPIEGDLNGAYTSDEHWLVPDTTENGSNDEGKTHGWCGFLSEDDASDNEITDMVTGQVTDIIYAKDGATAGEIRAALTARDSESK